MNKLQEKYERELIIELAKTKAHLRLALSVLMSIVDYECYYYGFEEEIKMLEEIRKELFNGEE